MNYYEIPINIHAMIEEKIYYLCYSRISKNTIRGYDQDDLAQELRIHIYKKLEKHVLNSYKNPKGWIVTCMKRKLTDIWRKQQRSKDAFMRCDICDLVDRDQED